MTQARRISARDQLLIWFSALAPPAAWMAHFALGYLFDEAACMNDTAVDTVEPLIVLSAIVFAAVSLTGGAVAYSLLRRLRDGELFDPRGRLVFVAVGSLIGSLLFTGLIVLEGVQIVSFSACRPG